MFKFDSVNTAFHGLIKSIQDGTIPTNERSSRNGKVLQVQEPVTVCFNNPRNRVLFNQTRDANSFFHLFESFWMLAGNNDVASLDLYNSQMKQYSDDGTTFHGAYGYRWKNWFGYDQLDLIVAELQKDPTSRRCVLSMWDGGDAWSHGPDVEGNSGPTERTPFTDCSDLYVATHGGKDVPCNLSALFSIRQERRGSGTVDSARPIEYLDIHIYNRSNDLIWGLLGANVVHFSFLLEYMANRIGVKVGRQYHTSNNLHIYTENNSGFDADALLRDEYSGVEDVVHHDPLAMDDISEDDLQEFVLVNGSMEVCCSHYDSDYISYVVQPAMNAFKCHKAREYFRSREYLSRIDCDDWKFVCENWIDKRETNWRKNND